MIDPASFADRTRPPRRRRRTGVLAALVAIAAIVASALAWRTGGLARWRSAAPESVAFPSSFVCAECHPREVSEWTASPHAYAGENILVHASVCGPCHAPVGTQLDPEYLFKITSGAELPEMPAAAAEGVTCVACHVEAAAPGHHVLTFEPRWPNWRTTDLALRLAPWATALGPFGAGTTDDPPPVENTSHASAVDARTSDASLCRACHEVTLDKRPLAEQFGGPQPLVPLLTTWSEWVGSTYPAAGRTCQSCHMPRTAEAAPAATAPRGVTYDRELPARTHGDHGLLGPDTPYWTDAPPSPERQRSVAAFLRTAAAVTIDAPAAVPRGATATIQVTMRNVGAGHDLPTGFGFWREVWLEVVVTDAGGGVVTSSGVLDAAGWLADEYSPAVRANPALYDPYLVQLRPRLVRSPSNLAAWIRAGHRMDVPDSAVKRNLNGTPLISWELMNADPIVARLEGAAVNAPVSPSPLQDVYVLRHAEAIVRLGIPPGASRVARYPVRVTAEVPGPLRVTARLLLRALGWHMTQQQEEIRDRGPIGPVYELGTSAASIPIEGG